MPIGLKGNSDGSGAIQIGGSDAISISTGLNTTFAGTITASGGVMYPLTSGTAIASTSGTALDFTSIPSWVKRITVMFDQVSLSGTSAILVQLGDLGGIEATGYASTVLSDSGGSTADSTSGFILCNTGLAASALWKGCLYLSLISGNKFVGTSTLTRSGGAQYASGVKELSATLDRVRITTVNGTDTFDAGSINILYE